jgi:dCMP deaminase
MKQKITSPKKEAQKRQTWDEYFLNLSEVAGSRATCDRGRSGCVITKDRRILSTGYVGSPSGLPHCDDVGHEMHTVVHDDDSISKHCVRTTHAEQNAIVHAARVGVPLEGGTLYCHMTPCYTCAKMIINAGIKKVVCLKDYHVSKRSKEIFKAAKIQYLAITKETEKY